MSKWKLVPVEPTGEMWAAAEDLPPFAGYQAMLAASPTYEITDADVERATSLAMQMTMDDSADRYFYERAIITAFLEDKS